MYSTKVIGMFVSKDHLPQLALYNEECETGNNKNFVSTTNGRVVYTYGDILPFSKENLEIYQGISNLKNKDKLSNLDKKEIYNHLINDYKKHYPHLNEFQTINSIQFINNEEFKKTYKNLSDFIPECKENTSLRSNEEILDLKNKLLEKYSTFQITPYVKDPRQNYYDNTHGKRYMIEYENINILNFIDELVLRGDSKEYYQKIFSGLIYDESYGKKVIDIDSFLEYSNSIDGLLESIEQVFSDKKFKELQKDVKENIDDNLASYDSYLYKFEMIESDDFPIMVKIQLRDSLVENCKENTIDINKFNRICDENNCVGYYKIYSKDEVYLLNNNKHLIHNNLTETNDLLFNDHLFDNITESLINNQKEYNPLDFVINQLLDNIDNINLKECKIYIDEHKITSKKKLEKVLSDYYKNDLMNEEVMVKIKTPEDTLNIWSEMQPYWMMEDGEDGNLYTGVPILNKTLFEQEINSVMIYHLENCQIDNEKDLDLEELK